MTSIFQTGWSTAPVDLIVIAMFYLTLLNSGLDVPTVTKTHKGNVSHADVAALVKAGDFETFADYFIDGLAHQTRIQTGCTRPIGETTANRIRGDLRELWNLLSSR